MKPDISKLPRWAREYIKDLERQRETAIRALNEYCDSQTSSPFFIEEMECTGEERGPTNKIRFITTNRMTVEYAGIKLDIYLPPDDKEIRLSWSGINRTLDQIGFIPNSYQQAKLIAKENMR